MEAEDDPDEARPEKMGRPIFQPSDPGSLVPSSRDFYGNRNQAASLNGAILGSTIPKPTIRVVSKIPPLTIQFGFNFFKILATAIG